jgi:hypothetical protein
MPPQITDRATDARDKDAICLTEVLIRLRRTSPPEADKDIISRPLGRLKSSD